MTTEPLSQYEQDENKLIDLIDEILNKYGINMLDIESILKDRCY